MDGRPPVPGLLPYHGGPGPSGREREPLPHDRCTHAGRQTLTSLRRFGFLYENVVMQPSMADEVSEALDAQPSSSVRPILAGSTGPGCGGRRWIGTPTSKTPKNEGPLQWTRQGKWRRLRLEAEHKSPPTSSWTASPSQMGSRRDVCPCQRPPPPP